MVFMIISQCNLHRSINTSDKRQSSDKFFKPTCDVALGFTENSHSYLKFMLIKNVGRKTNSKFKIPIKKIVTLSHTNQNNNNKPCRIAQRTQYRVMISLYTEQ